MGFVQEYIFLLQAGKAETDMLVPWSSLLGWVVLDKDGRTHIQNHKYKAGVYTPLDNALQGWWEGLTNLLPLWLHPNLVTFAGFVPILMSFLSAWYYCPDFATPPPRWLCFMMSLSLFIYQTMDAIDGKQARRIRQSTPLGQLFDHGCDCLACLSHHSMAACVCLPGATKWNLAGLAVLQTSFFMAQWQEHHTGVLYTAWGPVGVTETQYALMLFLLMGGIVGPDALQSFFSTQAVGALTLSNLFITSWVIFNFLLMGLSMYTTMTHTGGRKQGSGWVAPSIMDDKEHTAVNKKKALLELTPVVLLNVVLLFGWHADIIAGCPRALCLSFGFLFIYLTGQMIVFSMACTPFNTVQWMLLPFAAIAFASQIAQSFEMVVVQATLTIHALVVFLLALFWALTVIGEITTHLGIKVFTVGPPKDD